MTVWVALFLWPVVAIILYRRLSLPAALVTTILGGYLLLPSGVGLNLPVLPELNKTTIPALSALLLTAIAVRNHPRPDSLVLPGWIPRDPISFLLLLLLLGGVFATYATNRDVLVYGPRVLPGLRLYDAFSMLLELLLLVIPFLLGRKVLASQEAQRSFLYILAFAAFIYTVPTLYEVRMSPQLHMMAYGFFPHEFYQHMRGGGFRPVVFVGHGLGLSLFFSFALLAAIGIMRFSKPEDRLKWSVGIVWLAATLVLTKSLGPLLIVLVLAPVLLFLTKRTQLLVAACIAGIMLTYPMLRAAHLVPIEQVTSFAESISAERAASLMTRIENEEILLEKARQRPLFGWGIWGRQRVFTEEGFNLTITDGTWIIELGAGGWVRYLGVLGLLSWPVIALFFARREKIDMVCVTLAIIVSAKLVDLIPNSGIPGIIWLMAGALIGRLELRQGAEDPASKKPTSRVGYARGEALADTDARPEAPGYARRFPEKEASRPAAEAKPVRDARPGLSYKRPSPSTGYRK